MIPFPVVDLTTTSLTEHLPAPKKDKKVGKLLLEALSGSLNPAGRELARAAGSIPTAQDPQIVAKAKADVAKMLISELQIQTAPSEKLQELTVPPPYIEKGMQYLNSRPLHERPGNSHAIHERLLRAEPPSHVTSDEYVLKTFGGPPG